MSSKKAILILLIILVFEPFLWSGNGTSVADFLCIGTNAKTAGTGEAMSALSDGLISSYYNPAGLTRINSFQMAGMHSEWFQDMRYEYLGMAYPIGGNGAINNSQAPLKPRESGTVRSDAKKKIVYLVCAARYSSRANAEKHVESLKLFGYSSKIQVKNQNTFLVVLGKSDQRPKAEKIKSDFEKRGLTSFIEEE